jgi:hypothetical protein
MSQSSTPLVPTDFGVPQKLETSEFRLRMLTINDVVRDYDAVMSSVEHLKTIWPASTWPDGLTLEQNLIDLGWHQKEFQMRRSFAYTVVTPSESQVTGCVYTIQRASEVTTPWCTCGRRIGDRTGEQAVRGGEGLVGARMAVQEGRLSRQRHRLGHMARHS